MQSFLRFTFAASAALALAWSVTARAQVPVWPKVTPAEVTAAGIGVQCTGADYGNGTFVLAAYFGGTNAVPGVTPAVYTSADGTSWTRRALPVTGARIAHPRFLNGKFYLGMESATSASGALTGAAAAVLTSLDGITWTASTLSTAVNGPYDFVFGNGVYVATVNSFNGQANQVLTSADGLIWTPRTVAAGTAGGNLTFFNSKFYLTVFGGNGGGLYSSADGITWGKISAAPASPGLIAASPSTLLVTFFGATGIAESLSSDGATFAPATPGAPTLSESIRYLNGAFVAPTAANSVSFDDNTVRASSDGRTWATIATTTNVNASSDLAFGGGRWVFVGEFDIFSGTTTVSPGGGGGSTPPPAITAQPPATQSAAIGGSITFTITVTGTGVTYQWNFNNAAISGATNASYTISSVTAANAGSYTVTLTNAGGSITSNASVLSVAATSTAGRLINISIRAGAGTGSQTLIMGAVVGGAGTSGTKTVLVRGSGPALAAFGVPGVLADPVLTVFSGSTVVASNDDWNNDAQVIAQAASVAAFPFPAGSKDAALVSNPPAGAYSIQLTGKAGGTGVALAEIYDTTPAAGFTATTPRLVNVSARLQVGTGGNILIAGFVVGGGGPRKVLIRAAGPALASFGVADTLADPILGLYNGAGAKIDENDNWTATTLSDQQSVGAFGFAAGSKDAVLVATLQPGAYTAQVSGAANTTGVALVEIYELP